MKEKIRINIVVDKEEHAIYKQLARKCGKTLTECIIKGLQAFFEKELENNEEKLLIEISKLEADLKMKEALLILEREAKKD